MFISSDTNIWFDFEAIGHLEHPFLLNHSYYISDFTFEEEIHLSKEICRYVALKHLLVTTVNSDELPLVNNLIKKYPKLSFYDAVALAIAKNRMWVLLSGDGALREAANSENILCHGAIWIYDQLLEHKKITMQCYKSCLIKLLELVKQGKRRLPIDELKKRIER